MTVTVPAPASAGTGPHPHVIGLDTAIGSKTSSGTGIASSTGWCEPVGYCDKKQPFSKLPHRERLIVLTDLANRITLTIGQPDLVVMELPAPSRAGGGAHERAWLWWELYRWLDRHDIPVGLMTPNQRMLYATGKGAADKKVVVDAVARRWPAWTTGGDDNLADAVVLMAAGMDHLDCPITLMPQANRTALDKTLWPEQVGR